MNTQEMLTALENESKQLASRQQQIQQVIQAIKVLQGSTVVVTNPDRPVWQLAVDVLRTNGNGGLKAPDILKTLRALFPNDKRLSHSAGIYSHLSYAARKRAVRRIGDKYQAVA